MRGQCLWVLGSDLVVEPVEVAECVQVLACDGEPEAFAQHLVLAAAPQGPAHLPLHRLQGEHSHSGHSAGFTLGFVLAVGAGLSEQPHLHSVANNKPTINYIILMQCNYFSIIMHLKYKKKGQSLSNQQPRAI